MGNSSSRGAYNAVHAWAEFVDSIQYQAHACLPRAQWLSLKAYCDAAYGDVLDIANATYIALQRRATHA